MLFGRFAIVRLLLAADCAFFTFLRAAWVCFAVAMSRDLLVRFTDDVPARAYDSTSAVPPRVRRATPVAIAASATACATASATRRLKTLAMM